MRTRRWLVLILSSLLLAALAAPRASAQVTEIKIAAGTPADTDLQVIGQQSDAGKQKAMYTEFVSKYATDPMAVAYGYAQLAQIAFAAGDAKQAMEYGDKALVAQPSYLDALVSQVTFAQSLKLADKIVEYAARGGKAVNGIGTQPKPEGMDDAQFAADNEQQKKSAQQSYDFLQAAAYAAITTEEDPDKRWAEVQQFDGAFPKSQFAEQTATLAMYALQQKGDYKQLAGYGEKLAEAQPKNLVVLSLLGGMLAEDPKRGFDTVAAGYAKRALEAATPEDLADSSRKIYAGMAHGALGWVAMKQEKTPAAIAELKQAEQLVQGNDAAYSTVMFRLGFAYAKLKQYGEAKAVLNKCAAVDGPYKEESKKLLVKVNAAGPK
ncbi:MAG TPA: hypothetical protein VL382_05305 [Terriglobales bacterium]|nr:hypothetical protein [Terriglobales bacterium]